MVKKLSSTKAHTLYKKLDGTIVPGGSTICKVGEDQSNLISWAWNLGMQGEDYKKVKDKAADIGSVAHFLIESHFQQYTPNLSDFSRDAIEVASQVFEKFLRAWQDSKLTWVDSEVSLVSESYSYGGTLDIIARDESGKLVLIDIKSQPRIYGSVYRQIAGYEYLWNEVKEEKIEKRVIFRHGKEDPDDIEVRWLGDMEKHFDVFKAQLALYYAFRAINKKPTKKK